VTSHSPDPSFRHPLSARAAGVILHPTSLPGHYGVGDLGPAAYAWVDALAAAGQQWWQVLPLGPTGYGDSPYQCFSAFAGNPNLISPELLVEDGLLARNDLSAYELPDGPINYSAVRLKRKHLPHRAYFSFRNGAARRFESEWERFRSESASWLDDYSLFMALKQFYGGGSWSVWPEAERLREQTGLNDAGRELEPTIESHRFGQYLFTRQWNRLKEYAHSKGVHIIGDMPIFIAEDSADVWAHPELFRLDSDRRPAAVAGVPPDYFSATGQLWGNPLYEWDEHERSGFAWWVARVRHALRQVDLIRLDHFRGFEAYWEIPAGSPTAQTGRWVKGPGDRLLRALADQLGGLPLIAEDLGVITPEVDALRTAFGLPGMRILQFAFGGAVEVRFLPHNYENPTVVYTGTHDNETTRGWFDNLTETERLFACRYLDTDGKDIAWNLIRAAWSSVAALAVAPAQDLLGLGNEARMNRPGTASDNWRWRLPPEGIGRGVVDRLGELTALYGRRSKSPTPRPPPRREGETEPGPTSPLRGGG
jgi:4-alpha-glucanotransferase